ncbi:MAG: hypothetical protein BGO37_03785 [Cellulomonas sp. 73-92]|nr:MAG: hypothetical protein BGO37_03785 [Cellulomonas sp. 73-92]
MPTQSVVAASPVPSPVVTPSVAPRPTVEAPTATPGDTRTQVAVTVTSAQWNSVTRAIEVSSFVPVVEDGGTCTLTVTLGSATVKVDGQAYADASSTSCGLLTVPAKDLSKGTWHADVSYGSPHTRGSSAPQPVEVP